VVLVDDAAEDPFAPYGRVKVDHDEPRSTAWFAVDNM
jgi:hypothetical protein